tara:strand:+ start:3295 stop:5406 length:2112 start_codon:yes stop_codon:yes gene_type:complete
MKIRNEERFIQTNGLKSTNAFQINASSHMFRVLSDGLYSDKVTAVIRELTCNARDAHTAAGKEHVPYRVHLPTVVEPYFEVFDQGIGLSFDDIMSLYTTYGESLKNHTNDMIGGLGLGSKAGFAYADQYQVEGRWHGKSHLFSCYVDEAGEPQIAHISTLDTPNRPNGLQVTIPVNTHDVGEFQRKATALFEYYNPRPECNVSLEFDDREVVLGSDDWEVYKSTYSSEVNAIQGQIKYPIDRSNLESCMDDELLAFIKNVNMNIWFDIGELEVSANREALSYSNFTITNIRNKLLKIKKDMTISASKDILNCNSLWEASIKAHRMYEGFTYGNSKIVTQIIEGLEHKNKPLHNTTIPMRRNDLSPFFNGKIKYIHEESCQNKHFKFQELDHYHSWRVNRLEKYVFYYFDTDKKRLKIPSTIKMHYDNNYNGTRSYIVLVESSQSEFKALLNYLGNPPYYDVSTLPVPASEKRDSNTPRPVKLKLYTDQPWYPFDKEVDHNMKDGGVYVKLLRGFCDDVEGGVFRKQASLLRKLGDTTPIYGIPGTYHRRLEKYIKVWTPFNKHYEKVYKKHLSKLGDRKQVDKYLMLSTIYKNSDEVVRNFLTMFKKDNTIEFKYDILNSLIKDYKLYKQLDIKFDNKSILGTLTVKDTKYADTVSKELRKVWDKHPIVKQSLTNSRYSNKGLVETLQAMKPDVELILEKWSN